MFRIAMLRRVALACPAALLALAASAGAAPHAALRAPRTATPPLTFERNTGHWPGEVQFVARSGQGMLFLTKREIVLSLRKGDKAAALRLKRRGSNPKAVASGLEKQPGIVNYFIGNDPKKWRTKVPTYSRARLAGVYPGIDLVTYGAGKSRTLEYDFVVKPGEDPKQIRMTVSGARSLRTADGKLIASTSCGDVTLNRPYAYQTVNGVRKQVACSFSLERNTVAFQIARYDASRPLVVDPTLEYCTFLGGDATDNAYGVALDAAGAAIVCGRSYSAAFPTTSGVAQTSNGGGYDAFVTKLNSDGTALAFSAYLGGAGADQALAIAVDTAGVITVCGYTSGAFPTTTGAFQTAYGGGQDAFVTRLNAAGTELVYSTYLGKAGGDNANAIAVDSLGAAYVCGNTNGAFPTTPGAYDSTLGGSNDVFITKLNATGTALVYSTFVGSTGSDTGYGIAVDSAGSATVCGNTSTGAYPTTTGAFQTVRGGLTDGFVTRLNPDGTALVYSTYLGGLGADYPRAIAIGADGAVVIHGYTSSSDFPTTVGAYQTTRASGSDGFITKLDATGTALVYSTYLGGTATEYSYGLALDAVGAPVVCGYVGGAGFPVTADALQATSGGAGDAYIAKLDASGATMLYGSYLGGSGGEYGLGVALDAAGAATVVGYTASTGFPTTAGAYQTTYGGGTFDGYVTKISFGATAQPTTITADAVTCYASDTITLTGTLTKTSDSSALSGKTIQFKVDAGGTWTDAAAATGADGKATLSATAPATTGAHTIYVRFEADTDYAASDASNTLTIDAADGTTLVADDASAAPGASVTVSATLTKTTGATAVAGLQLEFRIGDSGAWTDAAALTDATGKASASLTAPATAGDATINARWAGSTHYAASSDTATLAVKTATTITADAVTCYASDTITLTGTLKKTSDSSALSGKTIQFKIDAGGTWTNASAVTGADGKATLSVTAPATTGAHTIYVRFQGDTDYAASDASNTLTIDAADATTLVADDASADPGAAVTVSATLTKTTGATAVAGLQLEFRIGDTAPGPTPRRRRMPRARLRLRSRPRPRRATPPSTPGGPAARTTRHPPTRLRSR